MLALVHAKLHKCFKDDWDQEVIQISKAKVIDFYEAISGVGIGIPKIGISDRVAKGVGMA